MQVGDRVKYTTPTRRGQRPKVEYGTITRMDKKKSRAHVQFDGGRGSVPVPVDYLEVDFFFGS